MDLRGGGLHGVPAGDDAGRHGDEGSARRRLPGRRDVRPSEDVSLDGPHPVVLGASPTRLPAIGEVPGKADNTGRQLFEFTQEMFHDLHRARDGTLSQRALKRRLLRLHALIFLALEDGARCGHAPTEGTCRQLLGRYDALWAFLDDPFVSPTNNAAERALRHAVIWRKLSFGMQSDRGSRFVETLLTVIETRRQQNRPLFSSVTEAISRHFAQQSTPHFSIGCEGLRKLKQE